VGSQNITRILHGTKLPFLIATLAMTTMQVTSADQGQQWVTRNDVVSVVLQLDRANYNVGDPIKLRVGMKNTSGSVIEVFNGSPWVEAAIVVRGADDNVISPSGAPDFVTYHGLQGGGARKILPGQTLTFDWQLSEWADVSHWGYKLDKPGKYSISAIPAANGYIIAGSDAIQSRFYSDRKTVNSNRVEFSISP